MSAPEYWERPRGGWYLAPAYSVRQLPAWLRFLVRAWEAWRANRWILELAMIRAGALVLPEGGLYRDARPWWSSEPEDFPDCYSRRQVRRAQVDAAKARARWDDRPWRYVGTFPVTRELLEKVQPPSGAFATWAKRSGYIGDGP